jgi:hypothetical protein
MKGSRELWRGVVVAACVATAVVGTSAASAGLIFKETFHDEETEVVTDFCGVEGLAVTFERVADVRAQGVSHGPDKLPYLHFNVRLTELVTNMANGNSVRSESNFVDKDLRVTDNGDGTLTILVLTTGNAVLYDESGNVIARNPGQTRVELLIDHGGTPTDPSDDEFLEFLGEVKASTGRSDDFCEAAVPVLTS